MSLKRTTAVLLALVLLHLQVQSAFGQVLMLASSITTVAHAGFQTGPRLNGAGRVAVSALHCRCAGSASKGCCCKSRSGGCYDCGDLHLVSIPLGEPVIGYHLEPEPGREPVAVPASLYPQPLLRPPVMF